MKKLPLIIFVCFGWSIYGASFIDANDRTNSSKSDQIDRVTKYSTNFYSTDSNQSLELIYKIFLNNTVYTFDISDNKNIVSALQDDRVRLRDTPKKLRKLGKFGKKREELFKLRVQMVIWNGDDSNDSDLERDDTSFSSGEVKPVVDTSYKTATTPFASHAVPVQEAVERKSAFYTRQSLNLNEPAKDLINVSDIVEKNERIPIVIKNTSSSTASMVTTTSSTSFMNSSLVTNFLQMYPVEIWRQNGYFDNDFLELINPHWLQFPPAVDNVYYVLAAVYAFIIMIGCFGNFLVIFMFFRCRSLQTPANTLVINLAISDLLMMTEIPIFVYNSIYLGPALGTVGCTIYAFIGGLTGTVSIITLTAISVDRYYVVVYPLDPNRRITGSRSKFCVIFTWCYGILFSSLPLLDIGAGKYVPEGLLTSCSFDYLSPEKGVKTFILVFFVAAWVLPFTVIVFCYFNILQVVIEAQKLARNQKKGSISSRHCKDEEKRRTEIKLAGIVVIVIALWFVAWTPYAIVSLLGIFNQKHLITPISSMIPALLAKTASCADPFIYAVTHPRFRNEIRSLLLRVSRRSRRNTHKHESITENIPAVTRIETTQRFNSESIRSNSSNVEEVMVMVDLPVRHANVVANPENSFNGNTGTNLLIKPIPISNYTSNSNVYRPPSWYRKPDFAKRSYSVKSLSRN